MEVTGVEVHDGVIPDCDVIVDWLCEQNQWQRSKVGVEGVSSVIRTSSSARLPMLSFTNPPAVHRMNQLVWELVCDYSRRWQFQFTGFEDVSVQRYEVGEFYDVHVDAYPGQPRVVSVVAYLNTVNVGGCTVFPLGDHSGAALSVAALAGRVLIFPSMFLFPHKAIPPVSGPKFAATFWVRQ